MRGRSFYESTLHTCGFGHHKLGNKKLGVCIKPGNRYCHTWVRCNPSKCLMQIRTTSLRYLLLFTRLRLICCAFAHSEKLPIFLLRNSRWLQNGLIFVGLVSNLARFGQNHATFPNTKDLGLDALPEVLCVFLNINFRLWSRAHLSHRNLLYLLYTHIL
jgi:hypothetical protein